MARSTASKVVSVCRHWLGIKDAVTGELWQKIEHSYSTIATRTAAEREQAFAAGFRTAMTMMVCGLSSPKSTKDGGK